MPGGSGKKYWIGFDLGGTKMLSVLYDDDFKELGRERRKTKGHEGPEQGLKRIQRVIEKTLEEAQIEPKQLAGIGIGCPGPIDSGNGMVLEAPNLGWKNVKVGSALRGQFKCPVVVSNDVDAGVYGEYMFGAGKKAYCVVGIFPGTGIGGGCVHDGQIFRGRNRSCMEIGHVPLVSDGQLDGCGNPGSVEAVASRLAISAAAAQSAFRGQAPKLYELAGTDIANIRSGVIADSVEAGDTAVQEIVERAASHIGLAIVGLVHLLAPDIVVMGGGLVEAMPKLFVQHAAKTAESRVLDSFRGTFKIVPAQLGDDAAVKGVAAWAKKTIEPPS